MDDETKKGSADCLEWKKDWPRFEPVTLFPGWKRENEEVPGGFSEKDAAVAYARAWNRLDPAEFIGLLAPDAVYTSMWVLTDLQGKEAVADYLIGKIQAVKAYCAHDPTAKVYAELGRTAGSFSGRHCVILAQGDKDSPDCVAMFRVAGGQVKQVDLCLVEVMGPVRSGVYPV